MINLTEYLNESILDVDKNIDLMDEKIVAQIYKDIKKFIKENYSCKSLVIADNFSDNGKVKVFCTKGNITFHGNYGATKSLTNGLFYWGNAPHDFEIVSDIDSFDGMPKKIFASLIISCKNTPDLNSLSDHVEHIESSLKILNAENITNLSGLEDITCRHFYIENCNNLTSLKGMPEDIDQDITIKYCSKLENLEGLPKKIRKGLYVISNEGLKSLKGPKVIQGILDVRDCNSLEIIDECPDRVGDCVQIYNCAKLTTLKNVPKSREIWIKNCPQLSEGREVLDKYYDYYSIFISGCAMER